jgi:hypothetical protein
VRPHSSNSAVTGKRRAGLYYFAARDPVCQGIRFAEARHGRTCMPPEGGPTPVGEVAA